MRDVHEWFGSYSADHQNPTNRAIHWLCVPVILWCVVAFLWLVPVPENIGRAGLWAAAAMLTVFVFYLRLSRPVALAMAIVFIACAVICEALLRLLGPTGLLWLAIGLFVAAWIGQFIGHKIEGRKPSFLTDLAYLLIGPAWLAGKVLRRLGIRY
ncbi:MAG: Mpo1-like protein [Rhodanobacteraceae bacterium]